MIRVQNAAEPLDFDVKVRQPGRRALLEQVGAPDLSKRLGRPRKKLADRIEDIPATALDPIWREALPDLRRAYRDICAYLGMRIHPSTGAATVDHFVSKSKDRERAYEWANFRLAASYVNTCKGEHDDVIDPFEVQDGWFVIDIGTFEVKPGAGLDETTRARVESTIARLKLNDPTYRASRQEYHDRYHGLCEPPDPWPLSWIASESPFVAQELRRQGRLRPIDAENA